VLEECILFEEQQYVKKAARKVRTRVWIMKLGFIHSRSFFEFFVSIGMIEGTIILDIKNDMEILCFVDYFHYAILPCF
jgi:hypothetical protein